VSDLGGLYRLDTFAVTGTELIAGFMRNIVNFHHGKPYLNRVEWEKVFSPLPIIERQKQRATAP
jgi:outer membrane translocation and assembly module TamA